MNLRRTINALLLMSLLAVISFAQEQTSGGIKGKVRAESGATVAGVEVVARQGEREVARATTNRKGEFVIAGLTPGVYGLTFRKPGLSVGALEEIEVRAGRVRELRDRLILKVDEGALAFVKGSVFSAGGRSVPGARVEIARLEADGSVKKIDGRVTNETGSFVFRLIPDAANYRITAKAGSAPPATQDVKVDGPAVYRVALSLQPAVK